MNCAKSCLPTASSFARADGNEDALHAVVLRHLEDQGVTPEVLERLRHELEAPPASLADAKAIKTCRPSKGKGELLRLFGYATEGPFLRVGSCVLAGWIVCLLIESLASGLRVEAAALGGAISVAGAAVLIAAWIASRRSHSAVTRLFCAWVIFYSLMLAGCLARAALWEHMTASVLVVVLLLVLALLSQPFRLWGWHYSFRAKASLDDTKGVGNGASPGHSNILPTDVSESSPPPRAVTSPRSASPKAVTTSRSPSPPRDQATAVLPSPRSSSPRPPPPGQPHLLLNKIIGALDLDPWDISTNCKTDGDTLATSQVSQFSYNKRRKSNTSFRSGSPLPGKETKGKQEEEEIENGVQHKEDEYSISGEMTRAPQSPPKSEEDDDCSEDSSSDSSKKDDIAELASKKETMPRGSILKNGGLNGRQSQERMSISVGGVLMDLSKTTDQEATLHHREPPRAPPVSRGVSFSLDEDNDLLAQLAGDTRISSRRGTALIKPQDLPKDFNTGQRVSFSRENNIIDLQPSYYSDEEVEVEDRSSPTGPACFARHAPRFSVVCTTTVGSKDASSESSSEDDEVEEEPDEDYHKVSRKSVSSKSDPGEDWDSDSSSDDDEYAGRALHKATRQTATSAARALKKIASRAQESSSSSSSDSSDSSQERPAEKITPSGPGRRASTPPPKKPVKPNGDKATQDESEHEEQDGIKAASGSSSGNDQAERSKTPPPGKGIKTKSKKKKKKSKKKKKEEVQKLLSAAELRSAFEVNLGKPFLSSAIERDRIQEIREALGMRSQYALPAQELLEKLSRIARHDSDAGMGLSVDGNMFGGISGGTSQDEFNRMRQAVAGQMLIEDMMSSAEELLEVPNGAPVASSDARTTSGSLGSNRRSTLEIPNARGSVSSRSTLGLGLALPNASSRRASQNVGGSSNRALSPLIETDESLLHSSATSKAASPRMSTRSLGAASDGSGPDQAVCTPCGEGLGLSTALRPSSPPRSASGSAVAPGMLTKLLCGNPGITLQEMTLTDPSFAAMTLQELIKRAGDEGLYAGEPAKPFGDSIVRRDSLNELGINLDSAFVQQMLTMLNGGQAPQKCNCKPGMPHSCMSPAASAFASLAATVSHTASATVQATAQASRRTSYLPSAGQRPAVAKDKEDGELSESGEDDSSSSSNSTDSDEGGAFGPCDSVGSTSPSMKVPSRPPAVERPRPPALAILNAQKSAKGVEAATSKDLSPSSKDVDSSGAKVGSPRGASSPRSPGSPKNVSPRTRARGSNVAEFGFLGELRGENVVESPKGGSAKKISPDAVEGPDSPSAGVRRRNSHDGDTEIGAGRFNLGALEPAAEKDKQVSADTDELAVSVEDQGKQALDITRGGLKGWQSGVRTRNQSVMSVFDSAPSKQTSHTELAQPEDLSEMDGEVFTRVPPEELALKIQTGHVQVIDVRGRDFKGGHIPGCANMRTSSILDNPASVLDMCSNRENEVKDIVFTCMYSKLRAPRCASAVARQLQKLPGNYSSSLVVSILQGGMHGWVNHWHKKNTPDEFATHVQEFDSSIWQDCADVGRSEGQLFTYGLVHSMDAVWSEGGQKELALALEDALRDRLRRVSDTLLSDPDAQDVIAVQKVDPTLMSPKSIQKRSMSTDSQKTDLRHKETLARKRSGSGASLSSRADSIVSQGRLEQEPRRKSLDAQSSRFSVVSIPEDNVLVADIESETECSDSSDESYSSSD